MNSFAILPDQLFYTPDVYEKLSNGISNIYIIEDPSYFINPAGYNLSYLTHLRASMREYHKCLSDIFDEANIPEPKPHIIPKIHYITLKQVLAVDATNPSFIKFLQYSSPSTILRMYYPASFHHWGNLLETVKFAGLPIYFYDSPAFIMSKKYIDNNFKPNHSHMFLSVYKNARIEFIPSMQTKKNKPRGKLWMFQTTSANAMKHSQLTMFINTYRDEIGLSELPEINSAETYIRKNVDKTNCKYMRLPINYSECIKILDAYTSQGLKYINFKPSLINDTIPCELMFALNIGIITPMQIINRLFENCKLSGKSSQISYVEIFIRHLIYRDYIHGLYIINSWNVDDVVGDKSHRKRLPDKWFVGDISTEIAECDKRIIGMKMSSAETSKYEATKTELCEMFAEMANVGTIADIKNLIWFITSRHIVIGDLYKFIYGATVELTPKWMIIAELINWGLSSNDKFIYEKIVIPKEFDIFVECDDVVGRTNDDEVVGRTNDDKLIGDASKIKQNDASKSNNKSDKTSSTQTAKTSSTKTPSTKTQTAKTQNIKK